MNAPNHAWAQVTSSDCHARVQCNCLRQPPTVEDGQVAIDVQQRAVACTDGQRCGTGPVGAGGG